MQAVSSSNASHLLRYSVLSFLTYSRSFLVSIGQLAAGASRHIICSLIQAGTIHHQQWELAAHLVGPQLILEVGTCILTLMISSSTCTKRSPKQGAMPGKGGAGPAWLPKHALYIQDCQNANTDSCQNVCSAVPSSICMLTHKDVEVKVTGQCQAQCMLSVLSCL